MIDYNNDDNDPDDEIIDTNVENYSVSELLELIGLGKGGIQHISEHEFSSLIESIVNKYKDTDSRISAFFNDVGDKLMLYFGHHSDHDSGLEEGAIEGLAMRNNVDRGGNNDLKYSIGSGFGLADEGQRGEEMNGQNYDDDMGGVAAGDYGDDDGGYEERDGGLGGGRGGGRSVDPNDVMGLRRDINRGLVSGNQQLLWERNQYLDDDDEDEDAQNNKNNNNKSSSYVNRSNKVKIFRDQNNHYQMKQKKIGISNSYNVPVVQGTTNPILRNTLTRIINIDSQFRQIVFPYTTDPTSPTSATSFTVVLSEPLTNVTSLKLNSINIPYTWYSVDSAMGNNIMYIDMNTGVNGIHTIVVPNGNYTPSLLVAAVSRQFSLNSYLSGYIDISYNTTNGLCFLFNYSTNIISFTFYDAAMIYAGKAAGGCKQSTKLNSSLGWLLGFRSSKFYDGVSIAGSGLPTGYNTSLNTFETYGMVYMVRGITSAMIAAAEPLAINGAVTIPEQISRMVTGLYSDNILTNDYSDGDGWIRSEAIVDCYGPQYFLLVIDDFNHSRVNSGVVGIGEVTTSLARPAYYNTDLPALCEPDKNDLKGIATTKIYVPTVPRTLTFPQLYTLNQIMTNRSTITKNREMGPKTSDVFAVIPLRGATGLSIGQHFIDSGVNLLSNQRSYFGPVVINKLRITLRDDKGYIVNLHGNDWSFSLVTEELYEF